MNRAPDRTTSGVDVDSIAVGDVLPRLDLPLTVYRLVMAAGSNRDFNSIHHNSEYARSTGAGEMYANTSFLMSAWERVVRDWAGDAARIRSIRGFRMRAFNYVGDTTRVLGEVSDVKDDGDDRVVEVRVHCENSSGVTVGPGSVVVAIPRTPAVDRNDIGRTTE